MDYSLKNSDAECEDGEPLVFQRSHDSQVGLIPLRRQFSAIAVVVHGPSRSPHGGPFVYAAEMSRRAEYWLEKALRDAEANGELATRADNNPSGKAKSDTQPLDSSLGKKPSRSDFIPQPNEASDLRKMGNATPDQFEQANREARAENNPSRANVVRIVDFKCCITVSHNAYRLL